LLFIVVLILASFLFSGIETGGYLLNRVRLRVRVRQGSRSARQLKRVLKDSHRFIFTVLIGNNIVNYLVSREVTQNYLDSGWFVDGDKLLGVLPWTAETAATLTILLPLFLLGEVFPKTLFRRHADTLMYRVALPLFVFWKLFSPLTWSLKKFFVFLSGSRRGGDVAGEAVLSIQGLREHMLEEKNRPVLNDHQHNMIDHLMSMDRVCVRQIMLPFSSIISISEAARVSQALDLMNAHGVDQLAVYSGSVRKIVGYLSLYDVMDPALDTLSSVKLYAKKAMRILASQSIGKAYRQLRIAPSEPVFVVDSSSKMIGQLHLKDIAAYIATERG